MERFGSNSLLEILRNTLEVSEIPRTLKKKILGTPSLESDTPYSLTFAKDCKHKGLKSCESYGVREILPTFPI